MLKDRKSKIAKRLMELKKEMNLQEVDNIFSYVRGLRISTNEEDYNLGCGLYHIGIRKINHKLFNIFIKIEDRVVGKAICHTVTETLIYFDEYLDILLNYHKENKDFPTDTLNSIFEDFETKEAEYYLVKVLDVEKDLLFMLEPETYEATKDTINSLKKTEIYRASKVNLQGLESYINHLTSYSTFVSFEVKLNKNRFSIISPLASLTFILPKHDLTTMATLMSNRGYLVSYED